MNATELADELENTYPFVGVMEVAATMLRQQQAEIDRLNYDLDGFKQNFFVSGFHLQIKMANEQLLKQQEQIDALKSELDRAVELYTDKAIENEALKKSHIELERGIVKDLNQRQRNEPVAWMSNGKEFYVQKNYCPDFIPLYTHPVKEQDESFDRTASHMAGEYVSYKAELTNEEINVVAILQDAEIVPVGHEIWKTGEEFNKYKRIVLATAKALRKASEK